MEEGVLCVARHCYEDWADLEEHSSMSLEEAKGYGL
jgi:hypothetical protein